MSGMGLAMVSAQTIATEVADGRLVILDVEGLPIVRQWFAVRRSERRLLPAAQALSKYFESSGAKFLPKASPAKPAKNVRRRKLAEFDPGG